MAKAVLANRIFIELQDTKKLKDTLTYRIPPANENYGMPLVLRSYKQYKPGIISIPIGRTDLIPEGHEVEDLRVAPEVDFPEFNGLLRPSQQEIYDQIEGNALINAKVSFGKTFTALAIAKKFGYKTLIITHTLALRNQWEAEIKKVFGITPGIIGSGKWNINSPIVVSNVQTLSKKAGLLKKEFGTIVVDETHHLPAKSFMETLDIFWAKVKIGLSGTLVRKDGKHVLLKDYFGGQLFTPPAENALEPEVHIHNPAFVLPSSNNWADRVTLLETNEAYQHYIAKLAAAYAAVGHHVLVVGGRVEFLEQVANLLGKTAVCITGNVKDRDELLKKVGDTHNVLCGTLSIFSEGISHNILSCVILATPINNDPLLEQLTGRIVRICEGKRSPVVVDVQLKDNTSKNQATARNKFYFSKDWKIKMIQ